MIDKVFESEWDWNMYSRSGQCSVGGSFKEVLTIKGNRFVRSELSVRGLWPDRSVESLDYNNLKLDFELRIPSILLSINSLNLLIDGSVKFVDNMNDCTVDLCEGISDQELQFSLNKSNRGILAGGTFRMSYSDPSFWEGLWAFGVDPSCVSIFTNQLQTAMLRL